MYIYLKIYSSNQNLNDGVLVFSFFFFFSSFFCVTKKQVVFFVTENIHG